MKICLIADLHIPETEGTVQYRVLDWALEDAREKHADLIVFVGDFSANGSIGAVRYFQEKISGFEIPIMIITGNSDLRTKSTVDYISTLASCPLFEQEGNRIVGLMDGNGCISEEIYRLLDSADGKTIVCGHHPFQSLRQPHGDRMTQWRENHPDTVFFYGHLHVSKQIDAVTWSLPAADPDKAVGENPSISYFDTQTRTYEKSFFECPVPEDFVDWIGISCLHPLTDIPYAMEHKIRHIEVRDGVSRNQETILPLLRQWRDVGGKTLSIHGPEIAAWEHNALCLPQWDSFVEFCAEAAVDRVTLHVPKIPVYAASDRVLHEIAAFIGEQFRNLPKRISIGIENMHMTEKDQPDESRRFGYVPEEVLRFTQILKEHTTHSVGVHLDVGHARNNAPFSQHYPISSWYRIVGTEVNGYHIHQVILTEHGMENHMPITDWYGHLISYGSFFREWMDGTLRKAPVFLEIRPERGYEAALNLLGK